MRDRLKAGDRREIGAAGTIADAACECPDLLEPLISFLDEDDPVLVAHSAHALMQISGTDSGMFDEHVEDLLRHLAKPRQWEIGEQIPKILARTRMSDSQLGRLIRCLEDNLNDKSAIAAACALQAIVDLALEGRFDRQCATALLNEALGSDRKALAARARRLRTHLS